MSFGKAMGQLLVVAVVAFAFAFGADWAIGRGLQAAGVAPHPAPTAAPAAPADAGDD